MLTWSMLELSKLLYSASQSSQVNLYKQPPNVAFSLFRNLDGGLLSGCQEASNSHTQSKVVNPRAALLSNYEVLTLLRELETDHLSRTKTAVRVKKEEEAAGHPPRPTGSETLFGEASENLRTIEVEVKTSNPYLFLDSTLKCL